jgi:hypothetical protein
MKEWLVLILAAHLLASCAGKKAEIRADYRVDPRLITAAIDFVYNKVSIPEMLRSNEKHLIIYRQTMPVKYCEPQNAPSIVLDDRGYLRLQEQQREDPIDFRCLPAEAIRRMMLRHPGQGTDFFNRNQTSSILPVFSTKHKVKIMDRSKVRVILQTSWWNGLFNAYPDTAGVLELAQPGHSSDGEYACIYLEFGCGGLWASGWALLFIKDGSAWKCKDSEIAWIS